MGKIDNKKVEEKEARQKEILKKYAELAKSLGEYPTLEQFQVEKKITRDAVKHHFFSKENLLKASKEAHPEFFADILDEGLYNAANFNKMRDELAGFRRILVTSAVAEQEVDQRALASAKNFARINRAALCVAVTSNDLTKISPDILNDEDLFVIYEDMGLNNNLHISTVFVDPRSVDPLQGKERIVLRDGSVIFASPKQRMKPVANKRNDMPFVMMTTGAITKPKYVSKKKGKTLRELQAQQDHVMGGIIVELEDSEVFHFRQIQFDKSGGFVDLGRYYQGRNVTNMSPEVLVLGDYHSIDKDVIADAALKDLMKTLKPKKLVVHDGFDGKSISHHDAHRNVYRSRLFEEGKLSLEKELAVFANDLNELARLVEELVVVESNHDDFLPRYLEDGRWIKEAHNYKMASLLNAEMVKGNRPLVEGVAMNGLKAKNVRWLKKSESFKVARVELGDHGDKGSNGAKGSLAAMERAYGNSISGHAHSPEILRGAWQVGTTSKLELDYNRGGSSSWFHTSCLLYKNGARQLINIVDGKWRMKPNNR